MKTVTLNILDATYGNRTMTAPVRKVFRYHGFIFCVHRSLNFGATGFLKTWSASEETCGFSVGVRCDTIEETVKGAIKTLRMAGRERTTTAIAEGLEKIRRKSNIQGGW